MILSKFTKHTFNISSVLVLSACATKKQVVTDIEGQMQGDVYTGTETVEY